MAHAHAPHAHLGHPSGGLAYAQRRAVRTVRLSAASKPASAQVVIRAETHEGGMFPEVCQALEAHDAAMRERDSLDAGCCSLANARLIAEAQPGERIGLKGNPPAVCRAAVRGLGAPRQPARSSDWEPSQGDRIRDHVDRTPGRDASLDWSPLNQVWSVANESHTGKTGQSERAHRDAGTHLPLGRLKAAQLLSVVRAPWAIENQGHWTGDVVWDEAPKAWCGQGVGRQVLGVWRLMADNLGSWGRCRALRTREQTRAAKRRGPACCDVLWLLICQAGRDIFPHRQTTAGL